MCTSSILIKLHLLTILTLRWSIRVQSKIKCNLVAIHKLGRDPSPNLNHTGTLVLDFQYEKLGGSEFLLFMSPSLCTVLCRPSWLIHWLSSFCGLGCKLRGQNWHLNLCITSKPTLWVPPWILSQKILVMNINSL